MEEESSNFYRSYSMSGVSSREDDMDTSQSSHGPLRKSFDYPRKRDTDVEYSSSSDEEVQKKKKKDDKRGVKRKVVSDSDSGQEPEEAPKLYCICRKSHTDGLMILCENCDQWFHGRCVKMTKKQSELCIMYYCPICREKDSSLVLKFKGDEKEKQLKKGDSSLKNRAIEKENFPVDIKRATIDSEDELDTYKPEEDVEDDEEADDDDDDDDEFKVAAKKDKATKRKYKTKGRPKNEKSKGKTKRGRKKGQNAKTKEAKGGRDKGHRKNADKSHEHHRRGRHRAQSDDEQDILHSNAPRHCGGPECINASRKGSKYCSDECGLRLATNRIIAILPSRIEEWQKLPCAADEMEKKELDKIRQEQNRCLLALKELDRKQVDLTALIERGKNGVPYSEEEAAELDNEPDSAYEIHCVTCGQEVSLKLALKHMDRCANKVESQTSFSSPIEVKIPGDILCNQPILQNSTTVYCRRLKIICPEHYKDPRINDDEICGHPIRSEDDPLQSDEKITSFCRFLRKKCTRHFNWEKLRQACIDRERFTQYLKWDELLERDQRTRERIGSRHGVVHLLLHRTIIESDGAQCTKSSSSSV